MAWRMKEPCADCPFNRTGPGAFLRRTLRRSRWAEILRDLKRDQHFTCHKTTEETGDGSNLMCAGAIAWQDARGLSSNLQRTMERIEWIFRKKEAVT